jgi:Zn-dependent M16 (insulinase) family peptidase
LIKKLIEAVLNRREFFLREGPDGNFPKGLSYAFIVYHHWIYSGNPIDALALEEILKELRRGLTEPYYEELIKKSILKNHHSSQITYIPVSGLANKWEQEIKEKLAEEKKKLSEAMLSKLIEDTREFQQWQQQQPTPEELARIPFLTLEDINPKAEAYPLELEKIGTKTILTHPLKTNGIVYLKAYFDLDHSPEEDLPWLALYASLMGMVDSKNYNYVDLSNEIYSHTGDLNLKLNLRPSYQEPDVILLKFLLSGKALQNKTDKLIELAKEFALYPLFADYDRLKLLIREAKAKLQARLFYSAESIAINRLFAPSSQLHHFLDLTSGLDYYRFLCDLDKKLDQDIENIAHKLEQVRETYFCQNNLLISITSDEEAIKETINRLNPLLDAIPDKVYPPFERYFHPTDFNEGIIAPIQVQYCTKGGNFFRKGYSYSGKLRVLTNILNSEYLYRELREKGGAYGTWAGFTLNGYMYFASYRDPNLERTLEVYDQTPEYLRNFECSKRDMERYIIGDISKLDYPKTPEGKGAQSDDDYITGFTQEDRQQIRDEVLSTRLEDIHQYADMIEEVMSMNHYCVVGNEAKLKAASELFDKLTPLLS